MAFSDIYNQQVSLLMRTLPYVAEESCFALKGGTAINLFIRNMPRLSVDIDLTYLPVAGRDQSLSDIDSALKRILDRQHPRDLFDVYQLLKKEGITHDLRTALIVYLISHDHSPHSLLEPVLRDISQDFEQNFVGMTTEDIMLDTLLDTRKKLITDVVGNMPKNHKAFLRSFYYRKPDWTLLDIDGAENLPAVRWRELNLDKASDGTCEEILRKLEKVIT